MVRTRGAREEAFPTPGSDWAWSCVHSACDVLCFCRKEAEVVLDYERSRMEAQQAAHCKHLALQPQQKEEVLQRPPLQAHEVTEQHDQEKGGGRAGGRGCPCTGEVSS